MGCDYRDKSIEYRDIEFQSTHPSWGATALTRQFRITPIHFNPRTHRGVRLERHSGHLNSPVFQSTHPSWGATRSTILCRTEKQEFQSTHPSWGATCMLSTDIWRSPGFQSTHPSWGATWQIQRKR